MYKVRYKKQTVKVMALDGILDSMGLVRENRYATFFWGGTEIFLDCVRAQRNMAYAQENCSRALIISAETSTM